MNLPICPNYLDKTCEKSDLRLHGESEKTFMFVCHTCKLLWAVNKPKTKEHARYENKIRNIDAASQQDRELARVPRHFGYSHIKNGTFA